MKSDDYFEFEWPGKFRISAGGVPALFACVIVIVISAGAIVFYWKYHF